MNTMARIKKPVSYALDPELLAEVDEWIAKQPVPPSKTAVIEAALRLLLKENSGEKN